MTTCESRLAGTVRTFRSETSPPYIWKVTSTGTESSISSVCMRVRLPSVPPTITTVRLPERLVRSATLRLDPWATVLALHS